MHMVKNCMPSSSIAITRSLPARLNDDRGGGGWVRFSSIQVLNNNLSLECFDDCSSLWCTYIWMAWRVCIRIIREDDPLSSCTSIHPVWRECSKKKKLLTPASRLSLGVHWIQAAAALSLLHFVARLHWGKHLPFGTPDWLTCPIEEEIFWQSHHVTVEISPFLQPPPPRPRPPSYTYILIDFVSNAPICVDITGELSPL